MLSKEERERSDAGPLRGAARLVLEATDGITGVVESMQRTIASGPDLLGRPLAGPVKLFTGLVYGSIRGVTRLVGDGIDAALARIEPLLGNAPSGREFDAVVAVLNGVLGDYLSETRNPLAIEMRMRRDGRALPLDTDALRARFPTASGKLLVLVHGSCVSDWQWHRLGHDHGVALERDLGYTPVYLHYNSGLHVSTNGRAFAALMEQLFAAWPVQVEEIVILAHSLGGLVSRSACFYAETEGLAWRKLLRKAIFLGTPHHGAALERGGNWVDYLLSISRYSAPLAKLGKIRSAGVTDMRFGYVLDEQWGGRDRFARTEAPSRQLELPAGVECYAIAATQARALSEDLPSDGLVSVDSALGRGAAPDLCLRFPPTHQWIGLGMSHIDLFNRPEVYETIRGWLSEEP